DMSVCLLAYDRMRPLVRLDQRPLPRSPLFPYTTLFRSLESSLDGARSLSVPPGLTELQRVSSASLVPRRRGRDRRRPAGGTGTDGGTARRAARSGHRRRQRAAFRAAAVRRPAGRDVGATGFGGGAGNVAFAPGA